MLDFLDFDNAATLFVKADEHKIAHLRTGNKKKESRMFLSNQYVDAVAFNYVVNHFDEVSITSDFEELVKHKPHLLVEILKKRASNLQALSPAGTR